MFTVGFIAVAVTVGITLLLVTINVLLIDETGDVVLVYILNVLVTTEVPFITETVYDPGNPIATTDPVAE